MTRAATASFSALAPRARFAALALALVHAFSASGARAQDAGVREAGVLDAGVLPDAPLPEGGVAAIDRLDAAARGDADAAASDLALESELPADRRPDVALRLEPETGAMTGDIVSAIVTVTLTDGDDVAVPRQEFGELELHDQRHTDRLVDGRREFTFELDFLMLEPGEHELPPIRLRVVTDDGIVGVVRTEGRTITVGSLTASEPAALPRPPTPADIVVMQEDYTLAWVLGILGAMLLSALLGWLVARWWKARPRLEAPPPPPRPPWEVALEKLTLLRQELKTTTRDADAVVLVDRTSDALRDYLGGRYEFNGLESTTDEVVGRMKNARLQSVSLNEIIALLGDSDLVKFAKAVPDQAQCERIIEGAERIVKGTIPMASAVSRASPGAGSGGRPPAAFTAARDPRAAWNPEISVEKGRASAEPDAAGSTREVRRVGEDGAPLPETNPPPPPAPPHEVVKVAHETLRDGTVVAEAPPSAPSSEPADSNDPAQAAPAEEEPADEEPSRPTPVGFSDPNHVSDPNRPGPKP